MISNSTISYRRVWGAVLLTGLLLALPAAAEAAAPIIPSTSVSEVTETSASLNGAVAPNKAIAEAHFEYVDEANYEKSGFAEATKTADVKVPLSVTGKGDLVGPVAVTGDLTEGSAVITNLKITSGTFTEGQPISGENIPAGAVVKDLGSGTLTLSVPIEAGKSKVGISLTGEASSKVTNLVLPQTGSFVPGQTIAVKGGGAIKAGTSIIAVDAESLTLSQPPTETIKGADLTATTTIAQGVGDIEDGGFEVLHVTSSAGNFLQGQVLTGPGIRPNTVIDQIVPEEDAGKVDLKISRPAAADAEGVALTSSAPQPIAASISGLAPQSGYHLRIAAVDSKGAEATGPEVVFFTQALSPIFPSCPNETFRSGELSPFGSPGAHLPDCRSYEQTTPVNKDGGDVHSEVQFAKAGTDGDSVVFGSTFGAPKAEGAQDTPFFLAQRGSGGAGWSARGLLPPASLGEKGSSLRGWSPDFSTTVASAVRLSNPLTEALYELHADGSPPALIAPYAPIRGGEGGDIPYSYVGSSADGDTTIFESRANLDGGGGPPYATLPGEARELYAWDAATGQLTLAGTMNTSAETSARLFKGTFAGPYDWVLGQAGEGGARTGYYLSGERAFSSDGSVFFTSASDGQLYERLNPTQPQSAEGPDGYVEDGHCFEPAKACTIHVSASQKTNGGPGHHGPDPIGPQPAAFMAASANGKTAYFTSSEKLTNDANTGPEQSPAQIGNAGLPDPDATKNESVLPSVHALGTAIDPAGRYIYWADPGRGTIGRAKLKPDGTGIEGEPDPTFITPGDSKAITSPVSEPGVYHPGASLPRYIAVDADYVYWTNTGPPLAEGGSGASAGEPVEGGGTIGRAALTPDDSGLEGEPEPEFITGATNPQGIAVDDGHIYWGNAGRFLETQAVGRASLDGKNVESKFYVLGQLPSGLALGPGEIYLSESPSVSTNNFLVRLKLDPSEGKVIKEDFAFLGQGAAVRGIAVDSQHVYWASGGESAIGRADLELTTVSKGFVDLTGQPTGLAITGAQLYYSLNGESPRNAGNDLYRFSTGASAGCGANAGCLVDISADPSGNGAEAQGVLGTSEDGSYVYFVANGVLDDQGKAKAGDCNGRVRGGFGTCNLYQWHDGTTTFVARLDASGSPQMSDALNWSETPRNKDSAAYFEKTSFLSADGKELLFRSRRPLTDYDNHEVPEYYLYSAEGSSLTCVTCNPSGISPGGGPTLHSVKFPSIGPNALGASSISSRHFSPDGSRVFFETTEALVSADVNGREGCAPAGGSATFTCNDVYEWEAPGSGTCTEGGAGWSQLNQGCIYLISTGKSAYPSFFLDASESGDDVFFITRDSLVGQDTDSITDVYDARVDGGLASQNPIPTPPCEQEACLPAVTPTPPTPAPPKISGPPDPKPKHCKPKKCKKHHKKRGRQARHRNPKRHGGTR